MTFQILQEGTLRLTLSIKEGQNLDAEKTQTKKSIKMKLSIYLVEITNKTQPCIGIYYSKVH